jgi:hypothetical protein
MLMTVWARHKKRYTCLVFFNFEQMGYWGSPDGGLAEEVAALQVDD